MTLLPDTPSEAFSDDEHALFAEHFDLDENGSERLRIKVRYGWDEDRGEFRLESHFRKRDGNGEEFTGRYAAHFAFFVVDALRDIAREIETKSGLWSRLLSSATISESVLEQATKLFSKASNILQGDAAIKSIRSRFEELVSGVLGLSEDSENVRIAPVPQEAADVLRTADLHIRSRGTNVFLPVSRHGSGSQSAAVMALFRTWAENRDIPFMFFGFEEPEAHLHPHVQRYVYTQLVDMGTQLFITTHSTFIADRADIRDIVLLRRVGSESIARQIPDLDPVGPERPFLRRDWEVAVKRYIEGNNAELFFARCLLLAEGDSERYALPLFAKALGIEFDRLGVSLILANSSDFAPFMRICSPYALDIPWVLLCDEDAVRTVALDLERTGYVESGEVKKALKSGRLTSGILEPNDCFWLPGNFERFLVRAGFLSEYLQAIQELDGSRALEKYVRQVERSEPGFAAKTQEEQVYRYVNKHGKPRYAHRVAQLITTNGSDPSRIPPEFVRPLRRVEAKAKSSMG